MLFGGGFDFAPISTYHTMAIIGMDIDQRKQSHMQEVAARVRKIILVTDRKGVYEAGMGTEWLLDSDGFGKLATCR